MNLCTPAPRRDQPARYHFAHPNLGDNPPQPSPERNHKFGNYRLLNETFCTSTQSGDTVSKTGKPMPRFDVCSSIAPPRVKILELLRPEDPGHDALEAIVRPAPRRGLTRPLDEDTRRFLERALQSPSPYGLSKPVTPEPEVQPPEPVETVEISSPKSLHSNAERSLAEELREAEEDTLDGGHIRRELLREFRRRGGGFRDSIERERLGKLALSVEDDEGDEVSGLSTAARRIDALLAESRDLHEELAGIHEDLQAQSARACRCAAGARALLAESRALRYLDDVVALLKGDVATAVRVRAWPFAIGTRQPGRNYII